MNQVLAALSTDCCLQPEALAGITGLPRKAIITAAGRLISRGLAARREIGCYILTPEGKDFRDGGESVKSGPRGPRNTTTPRRLAKATIRDRVWAAMRIQGKFTLADLITLAGGENEGRKGYANVQKYIRLLTQAGYLHELARREEGTSPCSNGFKRWRLIRDTGPAAPVWRAKRGQIFDPNLGEVTWAKGGAA